MKDNLDWYRDELAAEMRYLYKQDRKVLEQRRREVGEVGCEHHHEYSGMTCKTCGTEFCYACASATNVDEGGKYELEYILCPSCGAGYYEGLDEM